MPPKKFLFLLFFVPSSTFSFFLLFSITIRTRFSYPLHSTPARINLTSTKRLQHVSHASYNEAAFTAKEYFLVSNLVSRKAPCNLLFFGSIPQFLILAHQNAKGTTVFLEDDEEKIKIISPDTGRLRAYKVEYNQEASNAYRLLKHAREHFGCKLEANPVHHVAGCGLALAGLPSEVYERKWDIVVVDGPRGDSREAPGRMQAIYTAAVIARAGNATDVLVHDVDRMVEKWYSWEFLCQQNVVSSKGKLWHFGVNGNSRFAGFCPENNIQIL